MQLLEKDPARRPQSARDVIARLTRSSGRLAEPSAAAATSRRRPRPHARPAATLAGRRPVVRRPGRRSRPSVFFWQTPDGKVVRIECDDPAIKIAFEDGELKVAGAYKEPLTLKPARSA